MYRCIPRALLVFLVGSAVTWSLVAVSMSGGGWTSLSLILSQLFADPMLALPALAVPAVLSIATVVWSRRVTRLRHDQQIVANELERTRGELDGIRRRLADANAENEEVRDQLVKTTARMRLRLSRLLTPKYTRERAIEPADVLDLERMGEIQDALSCTLGIGSSLRSGSGDLLGRIYNGADFCRAIQDTSLGRQECFWFSRDMGKKAVRRKAPVYKRCTACGLVCGAVPITVDEHHVATWVVGQVRIPEMGDSDAVAVANRLGISPNLLLGYQRASRSMTLPEFETALRLVWQVAQEVSDRSQTVWHLSRNISRCRRAEMQLRLAWHALDNSDRALVFSGPENECLGASQAAKRLLGYSDGEIRKLRLDDLMTPAGLKTALAGPGSDSSERDIHVLDSRGRSIPVRAELCSVVVGGRTQRYLAFNSDVQSSSSISAAPRCDEIPASF